METDKHHPLVNNGIAIDHKKLVFNTATKEQFLTYLKMREDQIQAMLLWCSIIIVVSYMAVIISIVNFYTALAVTGIPYLVTILVLIIALFGAFLWLQYRVSVYKPAYTNLVMKEFLQFKIHIANRQIKLLSGYMIAYLLIVASSCLLCWYNASAAQKILQITTPLSILVYGAGLFLLIKLAGKRKAYLNYISLINDSITSRFSTQ